jgi:hypothetical protein
MKFHEYDDNGTLVSVESLKEGGANYQYARGYDSLLSVNVPFKILSWNIGYAGMSKEIDFFYIYDSLQSSGAENIVINIRKNGSIPCEVYHALLPTCRHPISTTRAFGNQLAT